MSYIDFDRDGRRQLYGWAPGYYLNTCVHCSKQFTGDKRAVSCAPCAYGDNLAKTEQQILEELTACVGDSRRWAYLLANKDEENMPTLQLDNDDTYLVFQVEGDYGEKAFVQFDNYIGWDEGVLCFLDVLGIKHSAV